MAAASSTIFIFILLHLAEPILSMCQWTPNDQASVECHLKILDFRRNSSSIAAMQVPHPGLNEAESLGVFCSDVFFFESQLRSDHFGSLDSLANLEISFCKLRTLPPRTFVGLQGLTSLKIHTHNKDWTSLQMEPDYESLVGLEKLQSLDMQLNNLHHIPPGFFCPLKNLAHIELSSNAISDLNHLGISHSSKEEHQEFQCKLHTAKSLHLRNNGLVAVTPLSLAAMPSLKHLDLSHNHIGVLVEAAFEGLDTLQTIDLSFNRLAAIPPKIFSTMPNLHSLTLANNTLGTIDLSVFSALKHLQTLNMSGNNLDENWIRPGIFAGLHQLLVLDLSSNHIARLEQGLVDELTSLQVLHLGHNKIHTIATHSFRHLANLHILTLEHNQLETVQRQTLAGLSVLNTLNLDANKLHTLHAGSLKNCTALASLGLSHNFLTQVPKAIHQLSSLQSLDISANLLGLLKRESLQGLPKLGILRLGRNELSRLGEGAFVEVGALEELDLGQNRFMSLEADAFKDLKQLKKLDLSHNQLEDVNGLFAHQGTLKALNLSSNHLLWFDYAFIPPSLEVLDIHSNNIDSMGNYYALRDNYNLKYVDASVNAISELHVLSILPGVRHINLSNNTLTRIAPNTFLGKKNLVEVHLQRNRLETLDVSSLMVSLGPNERPPQFFLAGNPLLCDCHLQWFYQMASAQLQHYAMIPSMNQLYPEVPDLDLIQCRLLNVSRPSVPAVVDLTHLQEQDFLCPYQTHCLALCLCCEYLACDCQMKCPEDCQCFHDQLWSANVVQCSHRNLSQVPSLVPMDATALHLNGNNLTRLQPDMFLGRTRLHTITIQHSNVMSIDNGTFADLDHLARLHLGHNNLKQLFGNEFATDSASGLALSLRELYLHHNRLVSIAPDTFKPLTQLATLRLEGNLLIEFPIWVLSSNTYLQSLTLSSNWWDCQCSFYRKFRMFIDSLGSNVVKDASQITCNSSPQDEWQDADNSCHHSKNPISIKHKNEYLVPVIIGISVVCVLAVLVAIYTFACIKDGCRIWLFSRYGLRIEVAAAVKAKSKLDGGAMIANGDITEEAPIILFDALLLYSNKDNEPYVQDICQSLEPTYRLCLLHRDLAGIYTSEAFKSAVQASKRHIVVLSKSFIGTEWQHFQDTLLNPKKLIIINVEDQYCEEMQSEDLHQYKEVKKYIKSNQSSSKILKWNANDEKQFWNSLKYYLPDPPKLPTKEGGAELDVSGAWKFSSDISSPSATHHRLPPIKKKCSSHSTASSINDSGIYDSHYSGNATAAMMQLTRSCGTNAVHHQRSSSALVETIRDAAFASGSGAASEGIGKHQRSKSFLLFHHQEEEQQSQPLPLPLLQKAPPKPPPKVGGKVQALHRSANMDDGTYASPPSILMQLAKVSPDLLSSLNATMTTPLASETPTAVAAAASSRQVKMISPVVARAKRKEHNSSYHQKSFSMAESAFLGTPKSSRNEQKYPPIHRRSASMLEPTAAAPEASSRSPLLVLSNPQAPNSKCLLQPHRPLERRSSSAANHFNHSRSVSSVLDQRTERTISTIRLEDLPSRKILHMSTSQLKQMHQRSSSSPYEGFVL